MAWEGVVVGFWDTVGGRHVPAVLTELKALAPGDFEVSDVAGQPDANIPPDDNLVVSFVVAPGAALATIHAMPQFHFFWAVNQDNPDAPQNRKSDELMPHSEVLEFRDFLTANWGWTVDQIAAWLDMTPGEVADWMEAHTRDESLDKFKKKWRQFTRS